ncbi:hypothetical protein D3C84_1132810 [compost metagenome]
MGHLQGLDINGDDAVVTTGGHVQRALVLAETVALRLTAGLQRQRCNGRVLGFEAGHGIAQQIEGKARFTVTGQCHKVTLVAA